MRNRSHMFALSLLVASTACGDDSDSNEGEDDEDAALLAMANGNIDECGLPEQEQETEFEDEVDRCVARCVADASCDDLLGLYCGESGPTPFIQCGAACLEIAPDDGFACGDGEKTPHLYVCDGEDDCANGKDEEGCADYTCKDGEKLPPPIDIECDGYADCSDGSDEDGCPNLCGE